MAHDDYPTGEDSQIIVDGRTHEDGRPFTVAEERAADEAEDRQLAADIASGNALSDDAEARLTYEIRQKITDQPLGIVPDEVWDRLVAEQLHEHWPTTDTTD